MKKYILPISTALFGFTVSMLPLFSDAFDNYFIPTIILGQILFVSSLIYGMKISLDDMIETSFVEEEENK